MICLPVAGLVDRPSGVTGVCTDVTTAGVSSVFPSVTVCMSRLSGTTSNGSVAMICLSRGKVGVSMVETGVSDKFSSAAEAECVSGRMARVVRGAVLYGTSDEMTGVDGVMETLTQLTRIQSDAMAAQAKAIAVQSSKPSMLYR